MNSIQAPKQLRLLASFTLAFPFFFFGEESWLKDLTYCSTEFSEKEFKSTVGVRKG